MSNEAVALLRFMSFVKNNYAVENTPETINYLWYFYTSEYKKSDVVIGGI